MTAALAILPQRTPARPQEPLSVNVKPAPRPKLTLNTQQIRTFGKGSSLRLDTLSAVSPTIRNTFSNAYAPQSTSTSISTSTAAPASSLDRQPRPRLGLSIDSTFSSASLSNSNAPSASSPTSASTLSSAITTASSQESATIKIPYKQPHNLTSILTNSPARELIPRKMAPARPLFPAAKRVSFRTPLEEEITTTKYTIAHSDLQASTSSDSTVSSIEVSSTSSSDSKSSSISLSISVASSSSSSSSASASDASCSPSASSLDQSTGSSSESPLSRGPRAGDKRDSSESDSDSAPETPVAGRRKRRRDWHWTLGPVPGSKPSTSTSTIRTTDDESS